MTTTLESTQEDLAYLRSLLEPNSTGQALAGALFVNFGGLYAVQTLVYWAAGTGLLTIPPALDAVIGLGPTVLSILVMIVLLVRHGRSAHASSAERGVRAAFIAVGATNVVLIVIIGSVAYQQQNFLVWLIYPAVVFALQGTAWLIAYMLRRQLWLATVALGWFGSAILLGLSIGTIHYTLVAGLSLLAFMVAPGAYMMRRAGPGS